MEVRDGVNPYPLCLPVQLVYLKYKRLLKEPEVKYKLGRNLVHFVWESSRKPVPELHVGRDFWGEKAKRALNIQNNP